MERHLARCTTFPSTDEDAVQALDAVRLEHLPVHIDQAIELALAAILGLVGVVEGVDEGERHGAGNTAKVDVLAELLGRGCRRTACPARPDGGAIEAVVVLTGLDEEVPLDVALHLFDGGDEVVVKPVHLKLAPHRVRHA